MSLFAIVKRLKKLLPGDPPVYILTAINLVISLSLGMVLPLLPLYAVQLKATPTQLGALVSLFLAGEILVQIPVGYLIDRLGSRGIMGIAMVLYLFVSIGYAWSHHITYMLILRGIQGIASGGILVAVRSYVSIRTPAESRGIVNAMLTAASNGGELLGPGIGGVLADTYNYQTPFIVLFICVGAFLPILLLLPKESDRNMASQAGIASSSQSNLRFKSSVTLDRPTIILSAIRFAEMAGFAVWLTVFAPYASTIMQWDAKKIGLSFSIAAAAGLITGPMWGILSDRLGRRPVLALGLSLLLVQVILVLLFPLSGLIWIGFFLGGAGGTGYYDAMFSLVGDMTEGRNNTGQVMGFIGTVGGAGSVVSPWVASMIWKAGSIHTAFVVDISLLLLSLLLIMGLPASEIAIPKIQGGLEA